MSSETAAESRAQEQLRHYIQTHNGLREALEQEAELHDDEQAKRLLLDAGHRALDLMELLQSHDDLWSQLSSAGGARLDHEDMAGLAQLADVGLPQLLRSLNYQEPPPARELVDEMVAAVTLALGRDEDPVKAARNVALARRRLALITIRLRRLVGTASAATPPSLARRALRVADRELDDVLVATLPLVLKLGADALVPGSSIAVEVGAALGGVVAARVLPLRSRLEDEPFESAGTSLADAYRAAVRLSGQAGIVDAEALGGIREGPVQDLAVAQAWIAEEAVRQALEAEPEGSERTARLSQVIEALRTARLNIISAQPLAPLAEAVENLLDKERLANASTDAP